MRETPEQEMTFLGGTDDRSSELFCPVQVSHGVRVCVSQVLTVCRALGRPGVREKRRENEAGHPESD